MKTKLCTKCDRVLSITKFNWKNKGVRRAHYCRECSRKYIKEHYRKNRKYYINKARKRNAKIRKKSFEYLGAYLQNHPCVDCGEKDILVLEFDHRVRSGKELPVSLIIKTTSSFKKLVKEVSKCDVRCANCHRRKTERELKGWRTRYAPVAQRIEHLSSEQG